MIAVYRKKWVLHIERVQREKANGATVSVGIRPSKCEIVRLKMDRDRKKILDRKNKTKLQEKGKHTEEEVAMTTDEWDFVVVLCRNKNENFNCVFFWNWFSRGDERIFLILTSKFYHST